MPPTQGLRVARYAEGGGYSPDQWARALAGVDWSAAELLSDKPDSSVWRATLVVQKRPMALVIKCEPITGLKRRVQRLLGTTHAHRHWRGAELLMRHGFRTAEPKAIVYGVRDGVTIECLIMEALDGRSLLDYLADPTIPVRSQHEIATRVGNWTARIWGKGIFNRDHKGSNILVPAQRGSEPALIDCVGLRYRDRLEQRLDGDRIMDLYAMLGKIMIEARGCGAEPRRSVAMRGYFGAFSVEQDRMARCARLKSPQDRERYRKARLEDIEMILVEIDCHGDPTPEHDPLGRPGRSESGPTGGSGGMVG